MHRHEHITRSRWWLAVVLYLALRYAVPEPGCTDRVADSVQKRVDHANFTTRSSLRAASLIGTPSSLHTPTNMKYAATLNAKSYIIEINEDHKVVVDGAEYAVNFETVAGQPVYSLLINGR